MPLSRWILHLEAANEAGAEKILFRCLRAMQAAPLVADMNVSARGGYQVILTVEHPVQQQWAMLVYDVLAMAQGLGVGWRLLGNLADDPGGVLCQDATSYMSIPGLVWAEWQIDRQVPSLQ